MIGTSKDRKLKICADCPFHSYPYRDGINSYSFEEKPYEYGELFCKKHNVFIDSNVKERVCDEYDM